MNFERYYSKTFKVGEDEYECFYATKEKNFFQENEVWFQLRPKVFGKGKRMNFVVDTYKLSKLNDKLEKGEDCKELGEVNLY